MRQPKPKPAAPFVIGALLLIAVSFWMIEKAHDETLLSLNAERAMRKELERQLETRQSSFEESMDQALEKIAEMMRERGKPPE